MTEAEMVPVTDEDRKAAEAFLPPRLWKEQAIADVAQAFARHRLAAEAAAIERAAVVAEAHAHIVDTIEEARTCAAAGADIATAIRSLKEGASHAG